MRASPATQPRILHLLYPVLLFLGAASAAALAGGAGTNPAGADRPKDPFKDSYRGYRPAYVAPLRENDHFRDWRVSRKKMRLSSEGAFFTLNQLPEDARANALVEAGVEKEQKGLYRQALQIYHRLITRYPGKLCRVSRYGVFVPVSQYAQRRLLNFPPQHLEHYRTLHDPAAKEAFESARRKHSLIGLSEIVDTMLATSYGGRALMELGNASLDTGHHLAALERFDTIRRFLPYPELRTPELNLKVRLCHRMLGQEPPTLRPPKRPGRLSTPQLEQLRKVLGAAEDERPATFIQRRSPPALSAQDYAPFVPSTDPLALDRPVWQKILPGARRDRIVFSHPVVTGNSVIYRHKNIVYCRSILNGALRWKNDLGGRAGWHDDWLRQYPYEDVLVQDGLVFTAMYKGGPSLVALDEVTGQLRWAYGPMVASTADEARMRFLVAPAGGPRTVFAPYILDNIQGETHTDTEYGLIAFDSASGRIRWRRELCRLAPGKFAAGFAVRRRNRVRSFTSPPLYHQGTIYHTTNAGAIAALDAQSGRVKWLIRYPYHIGIHDATRRFKYFYHCHTFGKDRDPSGGWLSWCDRYVLWPNQRPLLVGERLYVIPVDTRFFFCIDRRTGKVLWSRYKVKNDRSEPYGPGHRYFQNPGGLTYLLGPTREGRLVLVYSGHDHQVQLIDPDTGEMVWESPDTVEYDDSPVMSIFPGHFNGTSVRVKSIWVDTAARPFLDTDDRLSVMTDHPWGATYLCELDLPERRIVRRRRYYGGRILEMASRAIHVYGPPELKGLQDLPHKDKKTKRSIDALTKIVNDQVPVNKHGPFRAFARLTFRRYGVPFELRFGARTVGMVYDRRAVRAALKERRGPQTLFAKGELAYADARYADAARLLDTCLRTMPSEDLDFRSTVNQQLYQVHRQLARMAIRSGDVAGELAHGLGMARTGTVLADEIETLFALAEAYERRGDLAAAARCLRSIVRTYGHHEYPVAPVAVHHTDAALEGARGVMAKAEPFTKNEVYGRELGWSLDLLRDGLALYTSTVSPLPKPLTVRAGELASARLVRLRGRSKEFAAADEQVARKALAGRSPDEQLFRLPEFAGTDAAQRVLDALFDAAGKLPGVEGRRRLWRLADAARVSRLTVPDAYRAQVVAPPPAKGREPPAIPQQERLLDLAGAEGVNWLVLARRGQRANHPHLLFVGGRVRKRLDNKFILLCIDVKTGEPVWRKERIRLKGTGQEPGFFEAFVYRDVVVVHGLYDVLAFGLEDGALRWRFRGPFDFEIQHAAVSGDLLALSGKDETLALYLGATSPAGEVAWQVKESGDTYVAPYFCGDRFVSLRKNPYNLTVRYRATGRLMGRLALPDLSEFTEHPLLGEAGPRTLPVARDGTRLVVTDTFYYIMLDVSRPAVVWKRLIDANDLTRQPPLRFYLGGDHLLVLKEDYDQKAAWMLSAETGDILWRTDPKDPGSPRPLHSVVFGGGKLFGLGVHPGQGYAFVGRECKTGKRLFRVPVTGYAVKPAAALVPRLYGGYAVARVRDGQDFELRVFDIGTGKSVHTVGGKAAGEFGVHGQASATVQAGRVVLLTKNRLGL